MGKTDMKDRKWTRENFEVFHRENPEIYELFEKFALQAAKVRTRFAARAVFQRIRWETVIDPACPDYKLDDGWCSHYARLFMREHPELEGFFETRIREGSYFLEGAQNV